MLLYLILFIITMYLSFTEIFIRVSRYYKKKIIKIFTVIFIILSTIRTNVAGDYYSYKIVFENMVNINGFKQIFNSNNYHYEPLYSVIQFICKYTINYFPFFLFILAIIVGVLQYKIVVYWGDKLYQNGSGNSYELTSYFIIWLLYLGNIFIVRTTLALLICMFSVRFIESKEKRKFLLCILMATLFHYSAIIFIIAYFIYYYKIKIASLLYYIIFGSVFGLVAINKIIPQIVINLPGRTAAKVSSYMLAGIDTGTAYNVDIIIMLAKAIINIGVVILLCIMIYKKCGKIDTMASGYINLYSIGTILYISTMFQSFAFARIAQYYIVFQFPIFIIFLKYYGTKRNKAFYWFLLTIYLGIRYFVNLYSKSNGLIPFTTIFK